MGGGLKRTVRLSQRNVEIQMKSSDEEDAAGACCDVYGSFMPIVEEIVKAANSHPLAKEKAAELLKNVRDTVIGVAQEALGRNKVASNTGVASSNVPGMDRSKESSRKRPQLETHGSKSARKKR